MGIGDDIKSVFDDLGTQFTVLVGENAGSSEYFVYDLNRQVTKPFIREYFIEAELAYDTVANAGDVIQFDDGRPFMIVNKTPDQFENTAIAQACVFYKCNVSGEVRRFTPSRSSQTHHKTRGSGEVVAATCYGLLTESLFGHELETDEEIGQLGLERHEFYVPESYGVQIHDRIEMVSGEFLKVETIKKRRYAGVHVCDVGEDTR